MEITNQAATVVVRHANFLDIKNGKPQKAPPTSNKKATLPREHYSEDIDQPMKKEKE